MNGIGFYWILPVLIGFFGFSRIQSDSFVLHGSRNAWLRVIGLNFLCLEPILKCSVLHLVDVENPHYLNADDDCCQKVTFQTRWGFVLNSISSGSLGQSQWPFGIAWGWHGPAYSRIRRSYHRSPASDHIASPWGHKGQSHKWTHVLQTITLPLFTFDKDHLSKRLGWALCWRRYFDLEFSN